MIHFPIKNFLHNQIYTGKTADISFSGSEILDQKSRSMKLWLNILGLAFGLFVSAVSEAQQERWRNQSFEYMDTQFWVADDPRSALDWAEAQLQVQGNSDRVQSVKAINLAVSAAIQLERFDWIKAREAEIYASWGEAGELGLTEYYLNLGECLATYLAGIGQSQAAIEMYERTLAEARKLNDSNQIMLTLAFYGQFYRNIGRKPDALERMKEALELADNQSLPIHPYFRAVTRLTVIITLQGEGHVTDGDAIMEQALSYLLDQNLRSVSSILAYNMATTFAQGTSPNYEKAFKFASKARELSHSVSDEVTEAASLMILASIHNKQRRYADALAYAQASVGISRGQDPVWEAYGLRESSEALLNLGKHDQALRDIERALELQPKNFEERHADLLLTQSRVLERIGDQRKALSIYQQYHELLAKIAKGREEETYARIKADMALATEEQKNQILKQQVEIQTAKTREARQLVAAFIVMAVFLLLIIVSLGVAIRKSRQITQAKQKMQRVLDVIEEGILTIGPDLKVENDYSPFLGKLYPDIAQNIQVDAITLLLGSASMSEEQLSIIRETLRACIGDSMLSWVFNSGNLPDEVTLDREGLRVVNIHWQPVLDSSAKIQSFLLSLRDVTQARKMEAAIAAKNRTLLDLEIKMKELLATRFQDAKTLVQTLEEKIPSWARDAQPGIHAVQIKRDLHTFKGVARTLGLSALSSSVHNLESALDGGDFAKELNALAHQVEQYQKLILEIFGPRDPAGGKSSLLDIMSATVSQLKKQLRSAGVPWFGVEVKDYVEDWPPEILRNAESNLIHALTNSADHGYIIPHAEGRLIEPGRFVVEARDTDSGIELTVQDSGAGLNLDKLQTLAQKCNYIPGPSETWADVVFLDGASTSQTLSATSGRGVGMAAIKSLCRETGGDATIRNKIEGTGSELTMRFGKQKKSA